MDFSTFLHFSTFPSIFPFTNLSFPLPFFPPSFSSPSFLFSFQGSLYFYFSTFLHFSTFPSIFPFTNRSFPPFLSLPFSSFPFSFTFFGLPFTPLPHSPLSLFFLPSSSLPPTSVSLHLNVSGFHYYFPSPQRRLTGVLCMVLQYRASITISQGHRQD